MVVQKRPKQFGQNIFATL